LPIAVCKDEEQLKEWCKDTGLRDRYRMISTEENEVIVEPIKTTRPSKFAYLSGPKAEEIASNIAKEYSVSHIKLKAYRWNEERGPFVKVPIEE